MNPFTGPVLTDEDFFRTCLNLDYNGMETVRRLIHANDYNGARKAFAAFIRTSLEPDRFFSIPFEEPENIYKLPDETDQQACERLLNHVMVSVGIPHDFGINSPIDWMKNPTLNQYEEWTWQLNRHNELKLLAQEYRKTKDDRYARLAAYMFSSWVKQAIFPEELPGTATTCWRTIECGIRMGANWPYALHAFYQTEAFTDDILVDWYKSVWEHGNRISRHTTHGNWLIMEMNGLAQISILYPVFRQSLEWQEFSFQTLLKELDRQIYPDGFQYELSTGYHDVTINNYQRLILMADTYGITIPPEIIPMLEHACEVNLKLMMPNGCLPDINDGQMHSCQELFLKKKKILPDSRNLHWITSGMTEGMPPDYLSVALPWSGFFVMRNGWKANDTWALLDGAPFGHGHQHEDKLSLLIYAGGKLLLTEGGNYAYDDSLMRQYVRSTRSHNTVRVDGMEQNRRKHYHWNEEDITLKADLKWNISPEVDYGESSYQDGYGTEANQSIRHNRRVFFMKQPQFGLSPFFIVADRMYSDEIHSYECLWHIDSAVLSVSASGAETCELFAGFSAAQSATVICGQETPEWQGFVATGSIQGSYRTVNCISVKAKGSNLRMVTILYPHHGENPVLEICAGNDPGDEIIQLRLKNGQCLEYHESVLQKNSTK